MNRMQRQEDMKGTIRTLEGIVEVIVLMMMYFAAWTHYYRGNEMPSYNGMGKYVLLAIYAVLILLFFIMCEGFKFGQRRISELTLSQCIGIFIADLLIYFVMSLIANHLLSPLPILILLVLNVVVCFVFTYVYSFIFHKIYVPKDMLLIYGTENAVDLKFKMDKRADRYRITKVISYEEGYDVIYNEMDKHDAVVINDVPSKVKNDILKHCYTNGITTYLVPKISDIMVRGAEEISSFDTPLLQIKGRGLSSSQKLFKRILDVVLCSIAMIIAGPIMLVTAILIKAEDGGPVFYKQERITEGGRTFDIIKFRSMIVDAERDGKSRPATDDDPRITKIGKKIRATRIDEIPQILNILKGDMSIVGPRPERTQHMKEYGEEIPEFVLRTKVKGGLTGYAQIYGKYNTSAYDKLRLDLMYIENYSFFLDIKLILMTLQIIFKKESTEGFDKAEELREKREELINNDGKDDINI